jgi:hypothetical protein
MGARKGDRGSMRGASELERSSRCMKEMSREQVSINFEEADC